MILKAFEKWPALLRDYSRDYSGIMVVIQHCNKALLFFWGGRRGIGGG